MEHLRLSQSPAPRGKSFLESLNFCCGTIGLDLGAEVLSPRVVGSSERMLRTKRMTVKAPPLPAQVVRALEMYVTSDADLTSRHLAGLLLFMTYARSRCRDASRLLEEPLLETVPDGSGFLEAKAVATKGARDAKWQKLGLPVTAVRRGLIDAPWADAWLKVRSACEADAAKDGPLMLALDRDG